MANQASFRDGVEADVYPVHMLDNSKLNHVFVSFVMRFNDVLDPEKLASSLSRLLQIGDWRKLAGRLKFKNNGSLEIRVPKSFSDDLPAFAYTRNDLHTHSIAEHSAGRQFPKPTERSSIQPLSDDIQPFLAPSNFPRSIKEMVQKELPQLSMHATSFNDATLVAIIWPHTLMDAMGLQALLKAWSLILEGRETEVPPVLGARKDALSELDYDGLKQDEFVLGRARLMGWGKVLFMLRFLWDKFWNPKPELRTIFLPKDALNRIKRQAREEITNCEKASDQDEFISEGDILTAWATRAVAASVPKARPITVAGLLNGRSKISKMAKSDGVYIQNVVSTTFAFIPPEIAKGSLGPIALCHRRHLLEQCSEPQVLSLFKAMREELAAGKSGLMLFGPTNSLPIMVNNLTKAELIKVVNFEAAVQHQGEKTEMRSNPLGTMVMSYNQPLNRPLGWPNCFYMLGKDHEDNCWLMGSLTPKAWNKVEEELEKLKDI